MNNPENTKVMDIMTSVSTDTHKNDIVIRTEDGEVITGSSFKFGDCYTGVPNTKTLRIQNTTKTVIEVQVLKRPYDFEYSDCRTYNSSYY